VDGRPIYTTGILPDNILCKHLSGYSPPGFPQRTTERCDRFAYYSPNAGVRRSINNDILPAIGKRVPCGWVGDIIHRPGGSFFPGFNAASAEPNDSEVEQVEVAVNPHGPHPGQFQGACKTVPFVKHHSTAASRRFATTGDPEPFAIQEIVVQRRPVLVGDFHVLPKLPDHPTEALRVMIGYYAAGADGEFASTGVNIDLPANVNVMKWRGVLVVVSDRGLVYDCDEDVTVTALASFNLGQEITSAENGPQRAGYYIETERLLQAV